MPAEPRFFFSSRRRHTRCGRDWSSDVCSSDLRSRTANRLGAHSIMIGGSEGATRGGSAGGGGSGGGTRLRLARQARGFSQQQLAGMAGVSRQAVSAVESGLSDPSLRVALALGRALGLTVEELFGPGSPVSPVSARPVAPLGNGGTRVTLATVGDDF